MQTVVQWRPDAAWDLFAEASNTRLRTTQDSYQINVTASPTLDPATVRLHPGTNDLEHITWTNAPISVLSFARDTVDRTWLDAPRCVIPAGACRRGPRVPGSTMSSFPRR